MSDFRPSPASPFQGPTSLQMRMIGCEMHLSKFEEIATHFSHKEWKHILMLRNIEAYRLGKVTSKPPIFTEPFDVANIDDMRRAGQVLRKKMDAHLAERAAQN